MGGKRIYDSGDTEDIPEMRQLRNIDAAFVCMNLPYTMDVEQAVSAVREFRPKIVYPFHYRGRDGTKSDVGRFKRLVEEEGGIEVRLLRWYP
jgi:L-ascorbate metabolism protein UlaG (beta-lactamase superfamily)